MGTPWAPWAQSLEKNRCDLGWWLLEPLVSTLRKGAYYHSSFACMALFNLLGPIWGLPFVARSRFRMLAEIFGVRRCGCRGGAVLLSYAARMWPWPWYSMQLQLPLMLYRVFGDK